MNHVQGSSRLTIFFSGSFLVAFLNLSSVSSLTRNTPLLHYTMNLAGLMTLSLAPIVLYFARIIDSRECSFLFLYLTAGIATGSLIFLAFSVAWHLILDSTYSSQFLPVTALMVMLVGYNALFFGLFRQIYEHNTLGKTISSFDITHLANFRALLIYLNILASPPIIVLLLAVSYPLATVAVGFQVFLTILALKLHKWSVSSRRDGKAPNIF